MPTLEEEAAKLREEWLNLWFLIFRDTGFIRLTRRLGMAPKPWITEREKRYE